MGKLYVVATPIGNLGDISSNALDILSKVSVIAAEDTRVTVNLLRHFDIKTKLVSYHKYNETHKSDTLVNDILNGSDVAVVSDAGSPCISDPGSILVRCAIQNGIEVIGIPGPSAVITALMVSGFDIDSFSFYGFLDREKKSLYKQLDKIRNDSSKVVVLYESPKRIVKTLQALNEYFPQSLICVGNDLTKKFEKKYYGYIQDVIKEINNNDKSELGEYVIVLEKKEYIKEKKELCFEALLIDVMVKNNVSLKDAVRILGSEYNRNDVYEASLRLKTLLQ